jgi:uncharacterized membrane protein YdbT with pleckstrin-like domain
MAHYVNNNLLRDEHIVFETTYHWIIFFELKSIFTLFISSILRRWSDEFVVTNKRIVVKTGIISRYTFEMNLNKVETINVDQSIFGRIFGYGTIIIIGTGGTRETFSTIAKPLEFRRNFQEVSS